MDLVFSFIVRFMRVDRYDGFVMGMRFGGFGELDLMNGLFF